MGEVRTEVTLINIREQSVADEGYIPQERVRRLTVNAVVDTGAWTLVINEETREKLGLRLEGAAEATVAGGRKLTGGVTEPVRIYWKDRKTTCEALVLPGEKDVLLGALPLEGMDLAVHPSEHRVIGAHGDKMCVVVK
jgi:clan AA aspartic protease